jgi:hypothetical protein
MPIPNTITRTLDLAHPAGEDLGRPHHPRRHHRRQEGDKRHVAHRCISRATVVQIESNHMRDWGMYWDARLSTSPSAESWNSAVPQWLHPAVGATASTISVIRSTLSGIAAVAVEEDLVGAQGAVDLDRLGELRRARDGRAPPVLAGEGVVRADGGAGLGDQVRRADGGVHLADDARTACPSGVQVFESSTGTVRNPVPRPVYRSRPQSLDIESLNQRVPVVH